MSQDDLTPDVPTAPGMGAPPDPARNRRPASSVRGAGVLALLLALLAVLGVGYVMWRQERWQPMHAQALRDTQAQVRRMERQLTSLANQDNVLWQRLNDAEEARRALGGELISRDLRLRDLEETLGKLSGKVLLGQDALLLDETEFLLRMGVERYNLFHDAQGAAQAFALARQTLAGVNDNVYKGVQQTIDAERETLAKSQATGSRRMLDDLARLRIELSNLPRKPLDEPVAQTGEGVWARIKRVLSAVVEVRRDADAPFVIADASLARELVGLDLAQAQAAWLAGDNDAASAALQRAQVGLTAQFDAQSPAVQQTHRRIAGWLAELKSATPAQPGTALAELRHLRAVHALKSNADSGASASGTKP